LAFSFNVVKLSSVARGLTKAGIVSAALEILDEEGLEGLTVRAVAARLGVQAPALYWHVRDKQTLIDEMGTEVWRQIRDDLDVLPADICWNEEMKELAEITRRRLLAHRDGAKVFSGTYLMDASLLERQEDGFARMLAQGFSLRGAVRVYQLIYSFTVGFCIEEQSVAQGQASESGRYSLADRAARLDPKSHPLVIESGPEIFAPADERFDALLEVVVDAAGKLRTG
jgi:AcrR family transcriptional regulator